MQNLIPPNYILSRFGYINGNMELSCVCKEFLSADCHMGGNILSKYLWLPKQVFHVKFTLKCASANLFERWVSYSFLGSKCLKILIAHYGTSF